MIKLYYLETNLMSFKQIHQIIINSFKIVKSRFILLLYFDIF